MRHTTRTALVLLGTLLPVHGPAAAAPVRPLPLPGGIADAAGRTGYVANAHGGIDAVDLITGDLLWETYEAQRPLLLAHGRLYAQAGVKRNRLRILVFDLTQSGRCLLESDPLVFPAWVVTGEAHDRSFSLTCRLERHQLALPWQARAWYVGNQPTPERLTAARKEAAGLARVDLETGRVEMLPAEKAAPVSPVQAPQELDKLVVRWQRAQGDRYAALVLEDVEKDEEGESKSEEGESKSEDRGEKREDGRSKSEGRGGAREDRDAPSSLLHPRSSILSPDSPPLAGPEPLQRLVLHWWDRDTELPYPEKELLRGQRLMVLPTLDGRYLWLRDAAPSPDRLEAALARKKCDWSVFSTSTGDRVARITCEPGTQAVAVFGHRAYCLVLGPIRGPLDRSGVQARTLQALDLRSGRLLWTRPLAGKPLGLPR